MTRRPQRWVAATFGAAALFASAALGIGPQDARPAGAASSRAVVNIGGSNQVVTFGSSVTGLQALRMVASVSTVGFGGSKGEAVCAINGQGNPATVDECLVGPNGEYWSYWRAPPGASGWQYSSQGAGGTVVADGWVEGWRYGTGGPPPFTSFCAVAGCAPPPTAAPPTTAAAPSVAGSSVTAPGATPGNRSTVTTRAKGSGATATDGGTGDGASTRGQPERSRGDDDRELAAGTAGTDDGGSGSPAGVAAVGGIVAVLGFGGLALRRRRAAAAEPG